MLSDKVRRIVRRHNRGGGGAHLSEGASFRAKNAAILHEPVQAKHFQGGHSCNAHLTFSICALFDARGMRLVVPSRRESRDHGSSSVVSLSPSFR